MDISLTTLQSLNDIFSNTVDNYIQYEKLNLHNLLNQLFCYYQQKENRVVSDTEIRCILTKYYLILFSQKKEFQIKYSCCLLSEISLNYLVEDYLKHQIIPIKIPEKLIQNLEIVKSSIKLDIDALEIVYERKGAFNAFYLIHVFKKEMQEKKIINFSEMVQKKAEDFFGGELQNFLKNDIRKMFLDLINKENENFFNFLEIYFELLFLPKNKEIKNFIQRYLVYSFHVCEGELLRKCSLYLCKIFSSNFYFFDNQKPIQYSKDKLTNFQIDQFFEKYNKMNVAIHFRQKYIKKQFILNTQYSLVTKELLEKINSIQSPYIQLTFLNENFEVLDCHYITQSKPLTKYFYNFQQKDFKKQILIEMRDLPNKPSFVLDLFFKNHLQDQKTSEMIKELASHQFPLYINMDLDKLVKTENYYKISRHFPKNCQPIKNFYMLYKITRCMVKWSQELNLTGFILNNFTKIFKFTNLRNIYFNSLEDLSHHIYYAENNNKTFEELFDNKAPINPFLVYLQKKLFLTLKDFHIISHSQPSLLSLSHHLLLTKDIFQHEGNLTYYNSQLSNKIMTFPLNYNLVFEIDIEDCGNNFLLKEFLNILQYDFNISLYSSQWSHLTTSTFNMYNQVITQHNSCMTYFPLLQKTIEKNAFLAFALIQDLNLIICIRKETVSQISSKLNFFSVYNFLQQNYPDYFQVVDEQNSKIIFELKDFLTYNYNSRTLEDLTDLKIVKITNQIKNAQLTDVNKTDFYNSDIIDFLQNLLENEQINKIDNKSLQNYVKLLEKLKIQDIIQFKNFQDFVTKQSNKIFNEIISQINQNLLVSFEQFKIQFKFTKFEFEQFLNTLKLGSIAVLSPEYGKFIKTGGLAVIIEDLTIEISNKGEKCLVVLPYFDEDLNGNKDYLSKFGNDKIHQIKSLSLYNYAALFMLRHLGHQPSIILTNDWFAGFAAAYNKLNYFGEWFKNSKFVHIFHNLGDEYQGRIYLDGVNEDIGFITGLREDYLINPQWEKRMINPCRTALICSDQWSTVSKSYKKEILENSSMKELLIQFKKPFAFPNGVRKERILEKLKDLENHNTQKINLFKKYFNLEISREILDQKIILAFLGRICQQKGVHLILNIFEQLNNKMKDQIYFIVAGKADDTNYGKNCANHIQYLKTKYPQNFWGDPYQFFTDGPSLTLGADFFLMPSIFEPGGIVQHEALIVGTPVIAFKTGGLQDSIFEFQDQEGNGFLFFWYHEGEFLYSIERAIEIFKDKKQYQILRKNCETSFIDIEKQALAWQGEFYKQLNTFSALPLENLSLQILKKSWKELKKFRITFTDFYREYHEMYFITSFDHWKHKHFMNYDQTSAQWYYDKPILKENFQQIKKNKIFW